MKLKTAKCDLHVTRYIWGDLDPENDLDEALFFFFFFFFFLIFNFKKN